MMHFYRREQNVPTGAKEMEYCFTVASELPLTEEEVLTLRTIFAEGFQPHDVRLSPLFDDENRTVEVGPRMNFATAWSSNMVAICKSCGLHTIMRVERSRRYLLLAETDREAFISAHHDRMTEMVYPEPLITFDTGIIPEKVYTVPLTTMGRDVLATIPGTSMDAYDRATYDRYFVETLHRDPTIVEIMDLNNANSEHSRHGFFKGKMVIDGHVMDETLMEIVQSTLTKSPRGSLLAFCDNSSVIEGGDVCTIMPCKPGMPSAFRMYDVIYHPLLTAETHNFPTGVAPFPGAETGTGGRIRDVQATGRGGHVIAGTAGYCVGNLLIDEYALPWENATCHYPYTLARPRDICIGASNGASDYGNKFGEPVIQGFCRSFGLVVNGERWEWVKPIMFTAGVGQIEKAHVVKHDAEKGWKIVQIGGPAYRIGFGGGAASSMLQGENAAHLDFNAVQRGDAEMAQKVNRVVRACCEMSLHNPIESIHDQGAGGPANVLKELVEKAGGRVELRKIVCGDPTLSALEIWVCEYQERNGLLIRAEKLDVFRSVCVREKVTCEVLGEVTGDGTFTVYDAEAAGRNAGREEVFPVDIELSALMGGAIQKEFTDQRIPVEHKPLDLPQASMSQMLARVLRLLSVGSKSFLTNKVDRSVTGLIAQQQCCGMIQLPLSNVAVVAQSHFGKTGIATAIGEQPIKMILDPVRGARMAVTEALTNLVWAKIADLGSVKCSANWMWAPKLPGEGAAIYDAACAMRDLMCEIGIAIDGGKDSLSMATRIDGDIVKSPRQLVISAYAYMHDVTRVITPDIKDPGNSRIIHIDLSGGKRRLGGSALAHVYGQISGSCPDLENAALLVRMFTAVQELIDKDLILAGHDISDGGQIVSLLEMVFAGNCGIAVEHTDMHMHEWFAEEPGILIECALPHTDEEGRVMDPVGDILHAYDVPFSDVGRTLMKPHVRIESFLEMDMHTLLQQWRETSYQLERLQMNPACADQERKNVFERNGLSYYVPPVLCKQRGANVQKRSYKSTARVAILREEGSNGDREMAAAFYKAGFDVWDVTMTDLLSERINLQQFRGLVAVGGFSYADVPESAKGWAATIRFNKKLHKMFHDFYHRFDTFSLGVCNGCQLFALLGWVPWYGLPDDKQPRFVRNTSGRFESRWVTVQIQKSPAIMLKGMEHAQLGVWVAHGEGRLYCPDPTILDRVQNDDLVPMFFVDDEGSTDGEVSHSYPFNPNGSPFGITSLCSPDGRHLAMMPHPERAVEWWQWEYVPQGLKKMCGEKSPWMCMFENARIWCETVT